MEVSLKESSPSSQTGSTNLKFLKIMIYTYPPLWNVSANIIALVGWAMSGVDVVQHIVLSEKCVK